jgi:hypothetical protein
MQWSKRGAHLLLQTRVKTLNHELNAVFQPWYPAMQLELKNLPLSASKGWGCCGCRGSGPHTAAHCLSYVTSGPGFLRYVVLMASAA